MVQFASNGNHSKIRRFGFYPGSVSHNQAIRASLGGQTPARQRIAERLATNRARDDCDAQPLRQPGSLLWPPGEYTPESPASWLRRSTATVRRADRSLGRLSIRLRRARADARTLNATESEVVSEPSSVWGRDSLVSHNLDNQGFRPRAQSFNQNRLGTTGTARTAAVFVMDGAVGIMVAVTIHRTAERRWILVRDEQRHIVERTKFGFSRSHALPSMTGQHPASIDVHEKHSDGTS